MELIPNPYTHLCEPANLYCVGAKLGRFYLPKGVSVGFASIEEQTRVMMLIHTPNGVLLPGGATYERC